MKNNGAMLDVDDDIPPRLFGCVVALRMLQIGTKTGLANVVAWLKGPVMRW